MKNGEVESEEVMSEEWRGREKEHERGLLTSRKITPVSRLMTVTL